MTSRRLSQLSAAALAALAWWVCVSRPGVLGDEFVAEIIAVFGVLTLILFGAVFLALRWATGGNATYWTMRTPDQLRTIGWMIVSTMGVMLAGGRALEWMGRLDALSAIVVSLIASTLVPAAFLLAREVRWPSRVARPGWPSLLVLCVVGIGIATAWSWAAWSWAPDRLDPPSIGRVLFVLPVTFLAASMEEVVFRVMLMTALLERLGSRFEAVFLSAVAFGLMHVPGAFAQPLFEANWPLLQIVAFDYAPQFLMQVLLGLFLGVLWLRSGSIALIAAVHTLLNLGSHLAVGL